MKFTDKPVSLDRCVSLILPALLMPMFLLHSQVLARGTISSSVTSRLALHSALQPCSLGPGSVVTTSFEIPNLAAGDAVARAVLPPGLVAIPGSCVASGAGTCVVTDSHQIDYSGLLAANEIVTVTFKSQVADATPSGTELCIDIFREVATNPAVGATIRCVTVDCPSAGPGLLATGLQSSNDQLPGSVLVYNLYTSNAVSPNTQNTQFSVTNIEPLRPIAIHMFFVDGNTCSVSDRYTCLTANQTATFSATDMDPSVTGYLVMVATDLQTGCPINFNYLIGDAFVKFADGRAANLAAEGIAALAGGLTSCSSLSFTATLAFDGINYARLGAVLAAATIPSSVEGNSTLLVVNRLGGNLQTGPGTIGNLFGLLYDDGESPHSFGIASSACQFRGVLSNSLPRTSPQFEVVIPAGHVGWLKLWREPEGAISGAMLNLNPFTAISGSAYDQGHNLHKLRLQPSATITIPIFPPGC
ncbi:MAG: hypothetical protein ABI882_15315 [Acidobacteriota bacterium]